MGLVIDPYHYLAVFWWHQHHSTTKKTLSINCICFFGTPEPFQPFPWVSCQVHSSMPRPKVRKPIKGNRNSLRSGAKPKFPQGCFGSLWGFMDLGPLRQYMIKHGIELKLSIYRRRVKLLHDSCGIKLTDGSLPLQSLD